MSEQTPDPYDIPLEEICLIAPGIWERNEVGPFLERLRRRHRCIGGKMMVSATGLSLVMRI